MNNLAPKRGRLFCLAAALLLAAGAAWPGTDVNRDDAYYDALRDAIYDGDWAGEPCGRLAAFVEYIGGLELRLEQIEDMIVFKTRQVEDAVSDKDRRALQRELDRLYDKRDEQQAQILQTRRDAGDAATAEPGTACGTPNLFYVGDGVAPPADALPDGFGSGPRPLASLVDAHGRRSDFVANELIVPSEMAEQIAARWNGEVVEDIPPAGPGVPGWSLIVVDATGADTAALSGLVGQLTDTTGNVIEVSSPQGLAMLAVAAEEAAAGHVVGMSWVGEAYGYEDGLLTEALDGPRGWTDLPDWTWSPNPYDWIHLKPGGDLDMGVTEAWTLMDLAGQLQNRVGIGILDQGYAPTTNGDFPAGFRTFSVNAGTPPLGSPDPGGGWHGTAVLNTAAAAPDNLAGVIGTGSPVADVIAIQTSYDAFSTMVAVDQGRIAGAEIVNMSYGGYVPITLDWTLAPFDLAMQVAHSQGVVLIAAGGNDGTDDPDSSEGNTDNETCLFDTDLCWEVSLNYPCELGSVYCVGALKVRARERASYSNFGNVPEGFSKGEAGDRTINLFAPGTVPVGPDPNRPDGIRTANGTSLASPYVAGVAALVWAADPDQSAQDVVQRLHDTATIPGNVLGERDPQVRLVLEPLDAVRAALDDACPCVSIKRPVAGVVYTEGDRIRPRATFYGAGSAPTAAAWRVYEGSTSGPIVASSFGLLGTPILVSGGGTHVYQLDAGFDDGSRLVERVAVEYVNTPPVVELLAPSAGATLTDNETVRLRAFVSDPGFPEGLPDEHVRWFLGDSLLPIATGDDTTVSFAGRDPGFYRLTVEATDGIATVSDFVGINITEGGENAPPSISITNPEDGATFYGEPDGAEWVTTIDLRADISDADFDLLTVDWYVTREGGTQQYVGSGQPLWGVEFRVGSCFGETVIIRATVDDGEAQRSDAVTVAIRGSEVC